LNINTEVFQLCYLFRYGPPRISCEDRLTSSRLTTLESRIYNSSVHITSGKEVLQLERFFVLAPIRKQGNLGTLVYIVCLFKMTKGTFGTLGQKIFSARCVDFWNGLNDSTVSVDIIATVSDSRL